MTKLFCLSAALILLICFVLTGCTVTYVDPPPRRVHVDPPPPPPPPEVEFYELAEYGDWIDVYPFGTVWQPYAPTDWRPYVNGHWAWTNWDWTWISYEPFGWAVYHYGNWQYDPAWGWIWIPGLEWEAVRVQWIYYGDYVCWAPRPLPGYYLPDPWVVHKTEVWVVVYNRDFMNYDLRRFCVQPSHYKYNYKQRMTVYRTAPRVDVIEKHTRKPIPRVHMDTRNYRAGTKTYKKVTLPDSEKRIVQKYQPQTKKRVSTNTSGESPASYKEKQKRTTPQQQKARTTQESEKTSTKTKSKTRDKDSTESNSKSDDKNSRSSNSKTKKKG
jgi:hypothetical protein